MRESYEWFKIHFEQQEYNDKLRELVKKDPDLFRHIHDVFNMGIAYGMDEIIARIKDRGNLPLEVEKELLERLDS